MITGIRIDLLNTSLKGVIMAERLSDALIVMEVRSLCVIRSGLVRIMMVPEEGMPAPIITTELGIPTSHARHANTAGTRQPIVICLPWRYSWKSIIIIIILIHYHKRLTCRRIESAYRFIGLAFSSRFLFLHSVSRVYIQLCKAIKKNSQPGAGERGVGQG
jgi:hypothetical protein